jgi:hypothetical protein
MENRMEVTQKMNTRTTLLSVAKVFPEDLGSCALAGRIQAEHIGMKGVY